MAQSDIMAVIFGAFATVSVSTVSSLPGKNMQQDVRVVRHFLENDVGHSYSLIICIDPWSCWP
ncbi:hypothetical protein BDV18DRAFT_147205 [Aspergillus unguis]